MKVILFCQNAYAFGIMQTIREELAQSGDQVLWFIMPKLLDVFPFHNDAVTTSIQELIAFNSDAIICPGNEVPYYLRGLKVQIFHGLAGEKKGHFRIRDYFDLYLTQGPYFTEGFNKLKKKHNNISVIETGWPKLDSYQKIKDDTSAYKLEILDRHNAHNIILYAPTFSPSLTSAHVLKKEIEALASHREYVIHIKFHDLMHPELISYYKDLAARYDTIYFIEEKDIVKQLVLADLLISDTSSVIYEFLLLDKPVITLNNISDAIRWENIRYPKDLIPSILKVHTQDNFALERASIIAQYHPYTDGKSSARVVAAIKEHISERGVPEKRKISWLRRRKINKLFNRKS
ncbi:MAG: CDP-glycerol glycerophosphotransferase family protein [Dokdonia donghaensis]|nr:CDP-glycerol glycerophosphotransferase family protein [Dokdonia donghaensis]